MSNHTLFVSHKNLTSPSPITLQSNTKHNQRWNCRQELTLTFAEVEKGLGTAEQDILRNLVTFQHHPFTLSKRCRCDLLD